MQLPSSPQDSSSDNSSSAQELIPNALPTDRSASPGSTSSDDSITQRISRQTVSNPVHLARPPFALSRGMVIVVSCFSGGTSLALLGQMAISPQYRPNIPLGLVYGLSAAGASFVTFRLDAQEHDQATSSGLAAATHVNNTVNAGVERISTLLAAVQQEQTNCLVELDKRQRELIQMTTTFDRRATELVGDLAYASSTLDRLAEDDHPVAAQAELSYPATETNGNGYSNETSNYPASSSNGYGPGF